LVVCLAREAPGADTDLVELGRRLFMDPAASRSGRFACSSCHDPEHGFSDARRFSIDDRGPTRRHSQPVTDLRADAGIHWDGEFDTLRELLIARIGTLEHASSQALDLQSRHLRASHDAHEDVDEGELRRGGVAASSGYFGGVSARAAPDDGTLPRLEDGAHYREGFQRAFRDGRATRVRAMDAMEAYLRSLRSTASPYDRYRQGDAQALTAEARRGLDLFVGQANCAACHRIGTGHAFSDLRYHNTGIAHRSASPDRGRGGVSFVRGDERKFKTPSLRDVARRPPYMHDGSLATLDEVVRYYSRGCTDDPDLDGSIDELDLDERQIGDLVAFLHALTGEKRAGLGPRRPRCASTTELRVEDIHGEPIAGLELTVTPCGDRLEGALRVPTPIVTTTDAEGRCTFAFPDWTHVRVAAPGLDVGEGRLLPDFTRRHLLRATPIDTVSLRIVAPRRAGELPPMLVALAPDTWERVATLHRVRRLDGEAIYVAERPLGDKRTLEVYLDGLGGGGARLSLNLAGGASPTVYVD